MIDYMVKQIKNINRTASKLMLLFDNMKLSIKCLQKHEIKNTKVSYRISFNRWNKFPKKNTSSKK